MERISVRSSNVDSIDYDPCNQVLQVEFKTESIYHYSGVPHEKYKRLMSSRSKGEYLNSHIKDRYACSKC
ncbi:MAG: KTSC domain-containing protein [Candidatus Eremiobacteraeota bacterium]|nr:KTSC domain-containing protein [Candidatus Eremiobacteraeota bacterium]